MRKTAYERYPVRLSLYHRCMSVFLAYLMLIGPAGFQQLAQGDIQYSQLCTLDWANGGETIHYTYDDNGSVTTKITALTGESDPENNYLEKVVYEYNLANRLERVKTYDDTATLISDVAYKYNPDGIKVQKIIDPDGTPQTIDYLIDQFNHTGFAQVFVEDDGTDKKAYIIADDILAQATNSDDPEYLLYDGHGSTRQLVASDGSTVNDSYSYDGYGMMLGGNPTSPSPAATSLLYSGEMFDTDAQHYYNRARWYNPANGRFNRLDPYSGNNQDPQSLHKYLYCHANPFNGIDPSGLSNLFYAHIGRIVHRELAIIYKNEHPINNVVANYYAIPGTAPALKPDIMDYTLKEIAEIKPLNPRGIAKGATKLVLCL